jgi:NADH:ubiquinone oxidoreductase subunit 3 (subunit A)
MFIFFYYIEYLFMFLIILSFLYFIVAFLLILLTKVAIRIPRSKSLFKNSAYECGFSPFFFNQEALIQNYQVNFIIMAILYILFDIEIIFLLGWSVYFPFLAIWTFIFLFLFILLVLLGFFFEYQAKLLKI